MIGGHPGGRELTERLLSLGGLLPFPGCRGALRVPACGQKPPLRSKSQQARRTISAPAEGRTGPPRPTEWRPHSP